MLKSLNAWLGLSTESAATDSTPLRPLIDALDRLEPTRAQYLARFSYLLSRVARADDQVSSAETHAMERLLVEAGELSPEQAMLVVSLAKTNTMIFGTNTNFSITQEFVESTTYEQRLALARCIFAVAASDTKISIAEESEVHRITNHLRIEGPDLTTIRLKYRQALPGLAKPKH